MEKLLASLIKKNANLIRSEADINDCSKSLKKVCKVFVISLCGYLEIPIQSARASLIFTAQEVGSDVVFESVLGGSLDLGGLTNCGVKGGVGGISPSNPAWSIGNDQGDLYNG